MSEFEIASLDYQTATLSARHWANWIAGIALAVSAAVDAAQCAIVAWGIRKMVRANRERAHRADAQALAAERRADAQALVAERHADAQALAAERRAEAQTRAADQRHAENMAALAEQSRRLDALIEGQAEQRQALNAAVASLQALLERTAPNTPPA